MKDRPLRSELENIIPPEIKNDAFYNLIIELASTENIANVLEIGSSAGGGSTEAFVTGLAQNPYRPKLFCMEVSRPRFDELTRRYKDMTFVSCYNTSSVSLSKFPSSSDVESFYSSTRTNLNAYPLLQVLDWLVQDIEYVECSGVNEDGISRVRLENDIDCFDMVLIDGSEFTGKPELELVYGARWLLLDDVNIYKNFENYHRLKKDPLYELYQENWQLRNGYAVFKKRECEASLHPKKSAVRVILVDGIFFQFRHTGIARVWYSMLKEWSKSDFAASIILLDRAGTAPEIAGIRTRIIPAYDYDTAVEDRNMLQAICDEEGANLFCSTYYTAPRVTPSVFFGYDMIPENTAFFDLKHPLWQMKHHGIHVASSFIAISRSTAYDLMKFHPAAAGRTTIAHCGVDREKFTPVLPPDIISFYEKYNISKPYILFIGDRIGYKNAWLLFSALSQIPDQSQFNVICIGGAQDIEPEFAAMVPDVKIHILQLDDKELCAAYTGAIALAYPSVYEGFGLPILEAMACDCPVITCQNSSLPEAAGAAALYVRPDSPEEMIAAIRHAQEPAIRKQLIRMGRQQAARFSWSKMADTVQSALEQAASGVTHG